MPAGSSEVGRSGLHVAHGGYVQEELHPHLIGRKALEVFRDMRDNDALVGAMMFAIDMLCRQAEWSVEQGDAKDEDAEFLESCMHDMSHSWGDFISEILSMLPFGFSFHEIVYKKRDGENPRGNAPTSKHTDGKIGWRKMPLRAQETLDHWEFDEEGGLKAFVQRLPMTYQEVSIPIEKGLLFRTSVYKNNPEGRSVLRNAYASWFYKRRMMQIEGTGIERDLAGFPVFRLPAEYFDQNASNEQKTALNGWAKVAENIKRDKQEYILLPNAYDEDGNRLFELELLSAGGARQHDLTAVIQRYNQEIAQSVLADFILLGHEKVGSFALSSDKTDLFAVALGAIMDQIKDVLNRFAVPRLWKLNGWDTKVLPEITYGDIEKPDLTALGAYLGSLVSAGVPLFPDPDLEAYLREAGGLPEKSEEAERLQEEQRNAESMENSGDAAEGTDGGAGGSPAPDGSGRTVNPDGSISG